MSQKNKSFFDGLVKKVSGVPETTVMDSVDALAQDQKDQVLDDVQHHADLAKAKAMGMLHFTELKAKRGISTLVDSGNPFADETWQRIMQRR